MSADLGPGDWVECVRVRPGTYSIVVGRLYCIDTTTSQQRPCPGCRLSGQVCDQIGIALVGIHEDQPHYRYWCSRCFKPTYRPKREIIEALKAPVTRTPKVVRERSREEVS